MVSGFVTSPCDQLRIFSGEARLIRMASKSATGFARSNGLERNKVSSTSRGCTLPPAAPDSVASDQVACKVAESAGARPNQPLLSKSLLCGFLRALCVLCGKGLKPNHREH